MGNFERKLDELEEKIDSLTLGDFSFPTMDGRTVELDMSDVMEIYRAACKSAWQDEPIDRENELISDVLKAKGDNNIGHYLKCLIAGKPKSDQ